MIYISIKKKPASQVLAAFLSEMSSVLSNNRFLIKDSFVKTYG